MTDAPVTDAPEEVRAEISPQAYAAFIGQIALRSIWLTSARVTNMAGPGAPKSGKFSIKEETRWELTVTGFRAFHGYQMRLSEGDEARADIEAEFGVEFLSPEPMTGAIFAVFAQANLPVNTWPYLREFVAGTMGRFGWEPFTLPALKRGTIRKPETDAEVAPAKPKRTRRPAKKAE